MQMAISDIIESGRGRGKPKWNLSALEEFCSDMSDADGRIFFTQTLPFIVSAALALPHRLPTQMRMLRAQQSGTVTLTQQQVCGSCSFVLHALC